MHETYQQQLQALANRDRLRRLNRRAGFDFSSNDYLALSAAPQLRQAMQEALERGVAIGAGGSRLLRGNDPEHEALEEEAAKFFGAERVLYMGGGYVANFALLSVLPQRGDLVAYDELVHASAHEGMRAGRADIVKVKHNDSNAFDGAIANWRAAGGKGRIWIAIESLYSMDGDRAPLDDLMALARRHDAYLLIDEAHATGVFGRGGRGLAAHLEGDERIITLHTCGKALGAHGALICAPKVLCDFLINRARPFIYATAPSPLMAAAVRASLRLLQDDPARREALLRRVALANEQIDKRCGLTGSGSQIIPVILGSDKRAMAVAASLQKQGFDIRGIRPPTVPEGTSRLRLAITLNVDEAAIGSMLDALQEALENATL